MVTENSLQSRILNSFDRYRRPSASASTLDPTFEVVMHTGGTTVTLPGSVIAEGVAAQAAAGALMWTEFDDFVVDGDTIATSGVMLTLLLTDQTLTSTPVGLFLRFSLDRMTSEVAFMGPSETAELSTQEMPSVDALRAALTSS